MSSLLGGQGHGCLRGGGSRKDWTWRGKSKEAQSDQSEEEGFAQEEMIGRE